MYEFAIIFAEIIPQAITMRLTSQN